MQSLAITSGPSSDALTAGSPGVRVAPVGLLRVAALPFESLNGLIPLGTIDLLKELVSCEDRLQSLGERLSADLHQLVRDAPAETRPHILNVRRAVHAGKAVRQLGAAMARQLGNAVCNTLDEWLDERGKRCELLRRAEERLADETRSARAEVAMAASGRWTGLTRALATVRPELLQQLHGRPRDTSSALPSRLERALLGYWIRAAAKTSPFGQLMYTAAVRLEGPPSRRPPDMRTAHHSGRVRISRGLLAQAAWRFWQAQLAAGTSPVMINPTLRAVGAGQAVLLVPELDLSEGRLWRMEELSSLHLDELLLSGLINRRGQVCPAGEILAMPSSSGGEAPGRLQQLAQAGVLLPPFWSDAADERPEASLDRLLAPASGTDHDVGRLRELVSEVVASVKRLEATDEPARLGLSLDARAAAAEIWARTGLEPAPDGDPGFFEDGILTGVAGGCGLDPGLVSRVVADHLRPQLRIDPVFGFALARFQERFGAGGTCHDVVAFIMDLLSRSSLIRPDGQPNVADDLPAWRDGRLVVGATVFAQPIDGPPGSPCAVVNKILNGSGWLAARFADLPLPDGQPMAEPLAAWLKGSDTGFEPVDLWSRGDLHGLQAHPPLTDRVLHWPLEPCRPDTGNVVELDRCTLHHDPEAGLLCLRDAAGQSIAPRYLGSVADLALGPARMLLCLLRPLTYFAAADVPPARRHATMMEDRTVDRGVVLRRRRWWLRNSYLMERWFAASGAVGLRDVLRDRERLTMPPRLFIRPYVPPEWDRLAALGTQRKPLFVDTRSPLSLNMVEAMAQRSNWLIAEEMLPDGDQLTVVASDGRHVSELQLEMSIRAAGA
jgi:hypothetical protein